MSGIGLCKCPQCTIRNQMESVRTKAFAETNITNMYNMLIEVTRQLERESVRATVNETTVGQYKNYVKKLQKEIASYQANSQCGHLGLKRRIASLEQTVREREEDVKLLENEIRRIVNEDLEKKKSEAKAEQEEVIAVPYEQFVSDMTFACVDSLVDHMHGLTAEVGEVSSKIYKSDRDKNGYIDKQALLLELGDVLFYLVGMGNKLGFSLKEIEVANRAKLNARKLNGTMQGSGDNR